MTNYEKQRQTLIKKYGGEAGYRAEMKRRSNLSSRNQAGTGGFAYFKRHDPDKLKEAQDRGRQTQKQLRQKTEGAGGGENSN